MVFLHHLDTRHFIINEPIAKILILDSSVTCALLPLSWMLPSWNSLNHFNWWAYCFRHMTHLLCDYVVNKLFICLMLPFNEAPFTVTAFNCSRLIGSSTILGVLVRQWSFDLKGKIWGGLINRTSLMLRDYGKFYYELLVTPFWLYTCLLFVGPFYTT